MANVITKDMVENLNETLKELGCCFKYRLHEDDHIPTMEAELVDRSGFIDCHDMSIHYTSEYFSWLNDFFINNYNIKLMYNNTGSIVWSTEASI